MRYGSRLRTTGIIFSTLTSRPQLTFTCVKLKHQIKAFDRKYGWNNENAFALVLKCLNYLSDIDKNRFRIFTCTVEMDAWRKLIVEGCAIPSAVDLCVQFCPQIILTWQTLMRPGLFDPSNDTLHYFFDRGEPFKQPFEDKWNKELDDADNEEVFTLWSLIKEVAAVDSKEVPGVQAADVMAWAVNKENVGTGGPGAMLADVMRKIIPSSSIVWDEPKLRKEFNCPSRA